MLDYKRDILLRLQKWFRLIQSFRITPSMTVGHFKRVCLQEAAPKLPDRFRKNFACQIHTNVLIRLELDFLRFVRSACLLKEHPLMFV